MVTSVPVRFTVSVDVLYVPRSSGRVTPGVGFLLYLLPPFLESLIPGGFPPTSVKGVPSPLPVSRTQGRWGYRNRPTCQGKYLLRIRDPPRPTPSSGSENWGSVDTSRFRGGDVPFLRPKRAERVDPLLGSLGTVTPTLTPVSFSLMLFTPTSCRPDLLRREDTHSFNPK